MTDRQRFDIADYLADRDVPCHGCGYNLRGGHDPRCPECGAVIPRPLDPPVQQALRCFSCGYELGGAPVERCPECGSDDITIGDKSFASRLKARKAERRAELHAAPDFVVGWRYVPRGLLTLAALSIPLAASLAAIAPSWSAVRIVMVVCLLAPVLAADFWRRYRGVIDDLPSGTRDRLAWLLGGTGVAISASVAIWIW